MISVTIAVPVFNEAELLRATLEELRAQSFRDFVVLIYDNASTDATPDVAREFVDADDRFRYYRQDHNKGALANFHESLLAADTPFFLWRAADDRWSENYLEALHGLLAAQPRKTLAVGTIVSRDMDGRKSRAAVYPLALEGGGLLRTIQMLRQSKASWIYGLFRRERLVKRMNEVVAGYGYPWGFDHLVLLRFILDDEVAGTRATTFFQIIKRNRAQAKARRTKPSLELMLGLRRKFYRLARRDIAEIGKGALTRAVLQVYLWFYVGKRVYRLPKVISRSIRRLWNKDA